jgi:hypothetical protein
MFGCLRSRAPQRTVFCHRHLSPFGMGMREKACRTPTYRVTFSAARSYACRYHKDHNAPCDDHPIEPRESVEVENTLRYSANLGIDSEDETREQWYHASKEGDDGPGIHAGCVPVYSTGCIQVVNIQPLGPTNEPEIRQQD